MAYAESHLVGFTTATASGRRGSGKWWSVTTTSIAALFAQWIGPKSLDNRIEHWDARSGGSWRFVSTRDGEEYGFHGCFHEVRPDRIVQTFTFEGEPDSVALETLWFEDLGDGRTRLHAQSLVDSFAGRDAWLSSGMETGVNEGYAKLDGMLADGAV